MIGRIDQGHRKKAAAFNRDFRLILQMRAWLIIREMREEDENWGMRARRETVTVDEEDRREHDGEWDGEVEKMRVLDEESGGWNEKKT